MKWYHWLAYVGALSFLMFVASGKLRAEEFAQPEKTAVCDRIEPSQIVPLARGSWLLRTREVRLIVPSSKVRYWPGPSVFCVTKEALAELWISSNPYLYNVHDEYDWIAKGGYRSPWTNELCCGKDDCFEVPRDRVMSHRDGVILPDHGDVVIPGDKIQVSEDGRYWICKVGDRTRCFFAPHNGS